MNPYSTRGSQAQEDSVAGSEALRDARREHEPRPDGPHVHELVPDSMSPTGERLVDRGPVARRPDSVYDSRGDREEGDDE